MLTSPDFQQIPRGSGGSTGPGAQEAGESPDPPAELSIHPWVAAGFEDARADRSIVQEAMLQLLEVDGPVASRFADAWCLWRMWSRQNWVEFAENPPAITRDRARALPLHGFAELRQSIRRGPAGVVLTSPHMGDYLHLLLKVLLEFPDRMVLLCRRRPPGDLDTAVLARLAELGLRCELVITAPDAAVKLARGLRAGGIAVLMFDLPAQWGPTTSVPFLGTRVDLVAGPATLARKTGSRLVPIGAVQEPSGPRGFVGSMDSPGSPIAQTATPGSTTAALAADLSRLIAVAPDQWLHWNLLPEFHATSA